MLAVESSVPTESLVNQEHRLESAFQIIHVHSEIWTIIRMIFILSSFTAATSLGETVFRCDFIVRGISRHTCLTVFESLDAFTACVLSLTSRQVTNVAQGTNVTPADHLVRDRGAQGPC